MAGITKEEQKRRAELLAKGIKVCNKCKRELPVEQFSKNNRSKDKLNSMCKQCDSKRTKKYKQKHKQEIQQYYQQYRQEHKEQNQQHFKQYYQNNKMLYINHRHKRLEWEKQGNGFTPAQWEECLQFFNYECAYSGKPLDGQDVEVEHIVARANGGVHEIWNICPAIKEYNRNKRAKNMEEWYRQQEFYSEERLNKIYEWQQYAYNKWSNTEEAQ